MTDNDRIVPALRQLFGDQASAVDAEESLWADAPARSGRPRSMSTARKRAVAVGACALACGLVVAAVVVGLGRETANDVRVVGTPTPSDASGSGFPASFRPYASSWPSTDLGWILGSASCPAGNCTYLARTQDGGVTWTAVPGPPVGSFDGVPGILGLAFADHRNGWAVTTGAGAADLWATHDGGVGWARISLGASGPISGVVSIAASPQRVYASVLHGSSEDVAVQLFSARVDDDGSWSRVPDVVFPHGYGAGTQVITRGSAAWVTGGEKPGALAFATQDGLTWEQRALPCQGSQMPVVALGQESTNDVAVVCTKAPPDAVTPAYASSDGGRTFRRLNDVADVGAVVYVAMRDQSTIHLTSTTADGVRAIFSTNDRGQSWSSTAVQPSRLGWAGLAVLSPTRSVALPRGGPPMLSDDDGRTWRTMALPR